MQVTGSAKELVRELAPEHLAHGIIDPQTGQHRPGLMLLVQTLARRYSALDGEASTRAVSDFFNFNRLPGELTVMHCLSGSMFFGTVLQFVEG